MSRVGGANAAVAAASIGGKASSANPQVKAPRTRIGILLTLLEDGDVKVQNLAMLSLLAVFRDVLPSYRIRLPMEKELQQKVSKEVQKARDYERCMLSAYQVRSRDRSI